VAGWRETDLPARLRAMLEYADKLTRAPGDLEESDLEPLRGVGLGDEAILHLCEVVSYFNFVNRMADGLGVSLEARRRGRVIGEEPGAADS